MPTQLSPTISSILAAHGPAIGAQPRVIQGAYADYVQRGIACARAAGGQGQLFAEAETGTGKTLGYLVAALMDCAEHGSRAIVATHTKALQRQILQRNEDGTLAAGCDMAKAVAIVEAQTGKRLTAALRLGRRNFVDDVRAERVVTALLKKSKRDEEESEILSRFVAWAKEHPGAEIRDFLEEEGLDALPCGIEAEDVCISATTNKKEAAYLAYKAHAEDSRAADIVVTNHALLVANALNGGRLLHDADRDLGVLIVDECDRLESAARSASSDLLPLIDFRTAAAKWNALHEDGRGNEILSAIDQIIAFMDGIFDQYADASGDETIVFWEDTSKGVRGHLLERMKSLAESLKPALQMRIDVGDQDAEELKYVQSYGSEFLSLFKEMASTETKDILAMRWSPTRHNPSLRRFRLYPARLLKSMWSVWTNLTPEKDGEDADAKKDKKDAIPKTQEELDRLERMRAKALILTSATISSPDSTGRLNIVELSNVYGIFAPTNPCAAMHDKGTVFAPDKFGHVKFVFSHTRAPEPFLEAVVADDGEKIRKINPDWVAYTVRGIKAAMQQGGRVLVLCNSYRATQPICDALRVAGIAPIEKTRGNTAESCRRQFVGNPNGVFVTPGAWEGFDLSGEKGPDGEPAKIKHVVMTQLPFSRPDGPIQKAMKNFLMKTRGMPESRADGIIYGQIQSAAMRRFKQGFGRGIRSATDSFTFWITDPRAPRSDVAQNALPPGENYNRQFIYAIPARFRKTSTGDSAWSRGSVLDVDGLLMTAESMRELEEI